MRTTTINVDLSPKGIDRAIKELRDYERELVRKTELFRRKVAEKIADYARSGFAGAVVDDMIKEAKRYADVSVSTKENGDMTVVIADGEDAVFVEFGAGVYSNGAAGSSPHPKGAELGFTIGSYGKGYGKRQAWGFYEEGELKFTRGAPAVMPMYNAVTTVCAEISAIAREVWE